MKQIRLLCLAAAFVFIAVGCGKKGPSLHKAAAAGDIHQVRSLIAEGADVNAKDNEGKTPLALAQAEGYRDVAELLPKHGASEWCEQRAADRLRRTEYPVEV